MRKNVKEKTDSLIHVSDEGIVKKSFFGLKSTSSGATEADMEDMRRKDRKNLKKFPDRCIIVTMHHRNHTTRTFVVRSNADFFEYQKKAFIMDMRHARNDLSRGYRHLHFHEDCSSPIEYDVEKKGDKAWFIVTPETMLAYLKMEVVKAFVGSVELNKYLRMLVVITAAGTLCALIGLLLLLNQLRGAVT